MNWRRIKNIVKLSVGLLSISGWWIHACLGMMEGVGHVLPAFACLAIFGWFVYANAHVLTRYI